VTPDRRFRQSSNAATDKWEAVRHSTNYGNADTNFTLGELTPKHFLHAILAHARLVTAWARKWSTLI
jgi:hypothetical protein